MSMQPLPDRPWGMTDLALPLAPSRPRAVLYWIATVLVAAQCAIGGVLDLLRAPAFLGLMQHLGYPSYFSSIIGSWKVLAAVALIAPRSPRLKEWAYAGIFFDLTGAAASHLAAGDGAPALMGPTLFTGLLIASWALRPSERTLATAPT